MQECVHVTGSRRFSLVFNNTTNLAMHTCLCLKCYEAKQLVNSQGQNPIAAKLCLWRESVYPVPELDCRCISPTSKPLIPTLLIHLPRGLEPHLLNLFGLPLALPNLPAPAWDHAPAAAHEVGHYNGPVCECERHWCHIRRIQIHPSWN